MHWDPGKLRAHDRVAVSEAVANESVAQTRLAACVARLALRAARGRLRRRRLPVAAADAVRARDRGPARALDRQNFDRARAVRPRSRRASSSSRRSARRLLLHGFAQADLELFVVVAHRVSLALQDTMRR